MDQVNAILAIARGAQPNTSLSDASISIRGYPVTLRDARDYYDHDIQLIVVVTLIVVLLILIALVRAIVAPLYLVGSVILSDPPAVGVGVIRTVRSTGGVITAAGLIFAASMFGLLISSTGAVVQSSFVIGVGILVDTLVAPTITVPATAALLGRASWWPARPWLHGGPEGPPKKVKVFQAVADEQCGARSVISVNKRLAGRMGDASWKSPVS